MPHHAPVKSRRRALLAGAAVAFAVFGLIAALVAAGWSIPGDRLVFGELYSGESDWPLGPTPGRHDALLEAVAPLLFRVADQRKLALLVVVIVTALFLGRGVRPAAFYVAGIAVVALAPILKAAFGRPSPFPVPGDPSFPSGHATGSMAMAAAAVALLASTRWMWPAAAAGAGLVAAVSVGVIADGGHWPSDVLAGWSLAIGWVLVLRAIVPDPLRSSGGGLVRDLAVRVVPKRRRRV
jgi:membrane-associated phospholipid phosphatase